MIFREDKVSKESVEKLLKRMTTEKMPYGILYGAFGDMENLAGIVEEQIFPKEGGAYLKMAGCNYLLKGCPMGMIHTPTLESLGLAKAIIMQTIKAISKSFWWKVLLIKYYIFFPNGFYRLLNEFIHHIHGRTVGVGYFPEKNYNKFAKEVRRAFNVALQKEKKTDIPMGKINVDDALKDKKLRLLVPLAKFMEVAVLCIDFDTAYRFQSQDGLSNINKQNPALKELERILELMASRYTDYVSDKIKSFSRIIKLLKYSPTLKKIITNFIKELNIDEVKLDEADWYYCLRRQRYNFNGYTIEERLKEAERIDKTQHHIKINIKQIDIESYYKSKNNNTNNTNNTNNINNTIK